MSLTGINSVTNWLVVLTCFNHLEQYWSMGRIIPYSYIIENKKCLKSPTSQQYDVWVCLKLRHPQILVWNGNITRNTLEVSKFQRNPEPEDTLWYRKLPFIVSFPIENMVIFHSYVSLPEGTRMFTFSSLDLATSHVLFFSQA